MRVRTSIVSFIGGFCILLVFFTLIRYLVSRGTADAITVDGFLKFCVNVKTIPMDWLNAFNTNFSATFPSAFQWLGSIIDRLNSVFQYALYSSTAVVNLVPFIFAFLQYIFII